MKQTLAKIVNRSLLNIQYKSRFGHLRISNTPVAGMENISNKKCIFCKISRKEMASNILYEDDNYLVFPDHSPAALYHYLVIPRRHIIEVRSLKAEDVPMVKEMERIGLRVLSEKGGDVDTAVTGFHWPIHTVSHLHMHILSPSITGVFKSIQFSRYFFGSTQQAVEMLEKD